MKHEFHDQKKLILYAGACFASIILLQTIMYFVFFNSISNFIQDYAWWIFYLDITIASLAGALWYYNSYKGFMSCMACMMVAMTLAMQTGMMLGSVFGAVNGFFIGSMIGMLLGTFVGVISGRSYPMGVVQGAMAGVMGGTMGAMISLMMFVDNILIFMPFYMIINAGILYGFAYMYHEEVIKDNKDLIKKKIGLGKTISLTLIVTIILTSILVYAPKSLLFPLS
ncbi:MAG TPA: hypothetical protein VEC16_06710 [Alphaproteobacteria bacterium]|nr:hypothetical protein [Alphaproteobacteria bacterium]